jgi:hypothetical protein
MSVHILQTEDGFAYRDLNKNGRLDPMRTHADPSRSASKTCSLR